MSIVKKLSNKDRFDDTNCHAKVNHIQTMQWLRELLSLQFVLLTIRRFSTFWISFKIFPASFPDIKVAFLAFFPITSSFT